MYISLKYCINNTILMGREIVQKYKSTNKIRHTIYYNILTILNFFFWFRQLEELGTAGAVWRARRKLWRRRRWGWRRWAIIFSFKYNLFFLYTLSFFQLRPIFVSSFLKIILSIWIRWGSQSGSGGRNTGARRRKGNRWETDRQKQQQIMSIDYY